MKKCPSYRYCGGCQFQGIAYENQLETKQKEIDKLLSSFHHVEKIIPCKEAMYYRNKIQVSFAYDEERKIIMGYYMKGSHMIVPVSECMIADKGIMKIVSSVYRIIVSNHISIYDERSRKGSLRHLLVRSTRNGEYMAVLVTGSKNLPKSDLLVRQIIKYNPELKTIIHNVNDIPTSIVLGKRNEILYGKGYITDTICGLSFRISPSSFFQVNSLQTEVLYNEAIRCAKLDRDDVLIDAYCGTGTIGLCAASTVKKVIGVESNPSAIRDAEINRKNNGIENAEFICDDAGKYMDKLAKKKTAIDVVIMDPPRSGSDQKFMSSMVAMDPEKIVYVSCNPVTLKRDLSYLTKFYRISRIQPVDMFPMTDHVETVCCLYHQKKEFISVHYEPKDAEYLKQNLSNKKD